MTQGLSIHSLELDNVRLQLTFEFQQDRYSHRLFLAPAESAGSDEHKGSVDDRPAMASYEGAADQAWPVSPPFQQLSVEPIEGRDVALLTGMAGKSHWSASISPDLDRPFLTFDIATKYSDSPEYLGSRYEIGNNVHDTDSRIGPRHSNSCVVWSLNDVEIVVEAKQCKLVLTDVENGRICCEPNNTDESATGPARWIYAFGLQRRP